MTWKIIVHSITDNQAILAYHNDPKFLDRYAWANSADPDLIRVYTVCHFICIVWTHYSMAEPHSSNFRVITTNCLGVRIFRKFSVFFLFSMHQSSVNTTHTGGREIAGLLNFLSVFSKPRNMPSTARAFFMVKDLPKALPKYQKVNEPEHNKT